jgi:hypothetical protein
MCLVDARLQEQKRRLHNIMTYQNFENAVQYGRTMLKQETERKEVFVNVNVHLIAVTRTSWCHASLYVPQPEKVAA